jgi:hypothetical protein
MNGTPGTITSSGFEYFLRLKEQAGISTAVANAPCSSTSSLSTLL